MRKGWHVAMGFALGLAALVPSLPARAWTEARVESAGAALELMGEGRAHVNLRVGLRVLGGWLSRLELDGLDAGLVLDADQPPALRTEDGERLLPEVRMHRDGRLILSFPRRAAAPHRGRHELELHYVTRLGSEPDSGGRRVLRWALPAFRADLRDIDVTVDAPAGTAVSGEADGAVTRTASARGERVLLHWRRAQLPRTLAFEAAFSVPADFAGAAAVTARPIQRDPAPVLATPAAWAALCVLLLAAGKRAAVRHACRRARARALPLLGLRGRPRALAAAGSALAAAWLYPQQPWLGAAALAATTACALDRGFVPLAAVQPRWTRARLTLELARTRRARAERLLGAAAWFDLTTPLGLGLLASVYALALQRASLAAGVDVWFEALLAATPLWLSATRLALAKTPFELLYAQRTIETGRMRSRATEQPSRARVSDSEPRVGWGPDGLPVGRGGACRPDC